MDSEAPHDAWVPTYRTRTRSVCTLHGCQYESSGACLYCREEQAIQRAILGTRETTKTKPTRPYRSPELRLVLFLGKLPLRIMKVLACVPWIVIGGLIHASLVLHGRKGLWYEQGGWSRVLLTDIYSPGIKKGIEWRDELLLKGKV